MKAVKNVGHELDGEHFSIGLPYALDYLAEGTLAEHLDQLVVLLDGLPEMGVGIGAWALILYLHLFKIYVKVYNILD